MAGRESAEDKIRRVFGEMLDARDRAAAEQKDPKIRFDRVMGRLEEFLNAVEDRGDRGRRASSRSDDDEDEDDGNSLGKILGF